MILVNNFYKIGKFIFRNLKHTMLHRVVTWSLLCLVSAVKSDHQGKMAECTFKNTLRGTVKIHFTDEKETGSMFMGSITNLAQGRHGFHVHEVTIVS